MQIYNELEKLIYVFPHEVKMAGAINSPNPEDDLTVKTAIVGFSHHSLTEEWGQGHYLFLRERLDAEYSADDLLPYGQGRENIRLFFALCCGYLLELYQSEKIDERDFKIAEAQLAGLIALNTGLLLGINIAY